MAVSIAKKFHYMDRLFGMSPGENLTPHLIQSMTECNSQSTFDSKHKIVKNDNTLVLKHYNRPISFLRLNKNKNVDDIFVCFESGDPITCTAKQIKQLWQKLDNPWPRDDVLLIEEARNFKRDLFGAYFYHVLVYSGLCNEDNSSKSINPALLVFFQAFHKDVNSDIITITRHSIARIKGVVAATTFEAVEKMLEKNVDKKRELLLESTTRDTLGLPGFHSTNFFDLIHGKFEKDICGGTQNSSSSLEGNGRQPGTDQKGVLSQKRIRVRGDYTIFDKNVRGKVFIVPQTVVRRRSTNDSKRRLNFKKNCCRSKKVKVETNSELEVPEFCDRIFDSISKYRALNVFLPYRSVKLKVLEKTSRYISYLDNKFTFEKFKKFIFKNSTNKQYNDIMLPDHGDSRWKKFVGYQLECVTCKTKNKHKTRRKKWKCPKCKIVYGPTIKIEKNKKTLHKLLNENVFIQNKDRKWMVISSPRRYAHAPRSMFNAVRQLFKDSKVVGKQCLAFTPKDRKQFKKDAGKGDKDKYYMYPPEVPSIFGSCVDQLKHGKNNALRRKISAKRIKHACRLPMCADSKLTGRQVGFPPTIMREMGYPTHVIGVRYPSLGRLNMMLFSTVTIYSGKCVAHVSPVICEGQNLDFDGDCMSFFRLNNASIYETSVLIDPYYDCIHNGKFIFNFSIDAKLGLGFDGVGDPMHIHAINYITRLGLHGKNAEAFRLFTELEEIGNANATRVFGVVGREQLLTEIALKASKLTLAHYRVMFMEDENLYKGLSDAEFMRNSIATRLDLMSMPKYASDDGYTYAVARSTLFDIMYAYDGTLRTLSNEIVSLFAHKNNPRYNFAPIDYPYETPEEKKRNKNFKPLTATYVEVDIKSKSHLLNPIFKHLVDNRMRLFEVRLKDNEFCGRLRMSKQMKDLGLVTGVAYLVYFKFRHWTPYFFKFE